MKSQITWEGATEVLRDALESYLVNGHASDEEYTAAVAALDLFRGTEYDEGWDEVVDDDNDYDEYGNLVE